MRKIRASVLRKVEESRLTNKELTVFLHICQYQTDVSCFFTSKSFQF